MKKIILSLLLITTATTFAQVGINTTTPDPSSMLDISATNKGVLVPRLTDAQKLAITTPATGLLIYQSDGVAGFYFYNGTTWTPIAGTSTSEIQRFGNVIRNTSDLTSDNFIIGSTTLDDNISINTDNSRLFFNKTKGAFRAGTIGNIANWDNANVGDNSVAFGFNTTASGVNSTAMGNLTIASGLNSTAMGASTLASGQNSTAMGVLTSASGFNSTAMGNNTTASGVSSTAMGGSTIASGTASTAMGNRTIATGYGSTAMGSVTRAQSFAETAIGTFNTFATSPNATSFVQSDRLFTIGNGTGGGAEPFSNAMVVLKNGNTAIGNIYPTAKLEVDGKTKTTNLQVTNGAVAGSILTSDAVGNATWQTPAVTPSWSLTGNAATATDFIGTTNNIDLLFKTNNTEKARLLANGNFGIGTNAPNAPLQFSNGLGDRKIVLFEGADNNNQFYGFGVTANILRYQVNDLADNHIFYAGASTTNSKELMRIQGNGNVGIGTATPNAPLQFRNDIANRKIVLYEDANNDNQFYGFGIDYNMLRYQTATTTADHAFFVGTSGFSSSELMRIKGNGNVGIGVVAPTEKLDVAGKTKTTNLQVVTATTPVVGQVLTATDALGNMSWQTTAVAPPSWSLTGNAVSITDFLGTTNDQNIRFKRNNIDAGFIATNNSAIGENSLIAVTPNVPFSGTSGISNSAFGTNSLKLNTSGYSNSAVGDNSLSKNTAGYQNSAFGKSSLSENTTGYLNSAFGLNSMLTNTIGSENSAFGRSSLRNNTDGYYNSAFGGVAMYSNTTGNNNAAFGYESLQFNLTGTDNTAIGYKALKPTTGSNNIGIGANATVPVDANSNQMSIGNTIYGLDMGLATAKIGIGTSTPNAPLQFKNDIANRKIVMYEDANNDHQFYGFGINPGLFRFQTATLANDFAFYAGVDVTTSKELMRIKGNGKIGIGTPSPNVTLDVNGSFALRGVAFGTTSNEEINPINTGYIRYGGFGNLTSWIVNGSQQGQILIIEFTASGGAFVTDDNGTITNLNTNGTFNAGPGDTLQLIWNGSKWIELTRSDN